jgi:ribosomal protein S18 acetylase RimI-like enzyme
MRQYTVIPLGDMAAALLPELAAVELRAFQASAAYDDEPWQVENFVRPLPDKTELSLVAMAGGPIGFLVASRRPGGVHVHRLAVDPGHQRAGIASDRARLSPADLPALLTTYSLSERGRPP